MICTCAYFSSLLIITSHHISYPLSINLSHAVRLFVLYGKYHSVVNTCTKPGGKIGWILQKHSFLLLLFQKEGTGERIEYRENSMRI